MLRTFLRCKAFEYPEKLFMWNMTVCCLAFDSQVAITFFRFRGGDCFFLRLSTAVDPGWGIYFRRRAAATQVNLNRVRMVTLRKPFGPNCSKQNYIFWEQWFLAWVPSSLRVSVSQRQGLGGLVHSTRIIYDVTLCLAVPSTSTVYSCIHMCYVYRFRYMGLRGLCYNNQLHACVVLNWS